jgi:hypothetical protein
MFKFTDRNAVRSRVQSWGNVAAFKTGLMTGSTARAVRLFNIDTAGVLTAVAEVLGLRKRRETKLPATSHLLTQHALGKYFEQIQPSFTNQPLYVTHPDPLLRAVAYCPHAIAVVEGELTLVAVTSIVCGKVNITASGLVDDVQLGMYVCGCMCAVVLCIDAKGCIIGMHPVDHDPEWGPKFTTNANEFASIFTDWFSARSDAMDLIMGRPILEKLIANDLVEINSLESQIQARNRLSM